MAAVNVQDMKTSPGIALIAAAALAVGAPAASAPTREYEGTVVSVDRGARTFRCVTPSAARSASMSPAPPASSGSRFAGLHAGQTNIETIVRRSAAGGSRSRSSAQAAAAATAAMTTTS